MTVEADRSGAIILAGGRATRLGGAAKPLLDIGGRTLLDRVVHAVADCSPIVVVGPAAVTAQKVIWTREEPPFGGPVAGIAAGLVRIDSAEVYLVAADLVHPDDAVAALRRHPPLADGMDGVCLSDADGRMQWLTGRYRTDALRAAVAALPASGRDASMRSFLAPLSLTACRAGDLAADVDTWHDLDRARASIPARGPRQPLEETP
ncbi:molybdenum cofactor guanylyltransferase [Microbacterium sp. CR_7]|uniref:molybdenum cofactor guanylyltransferase n=1 Tax=Microbacterium sp. CR_7 TaxID=3055792 RepID=UPI0035BF48E5